MTTMIPPTELSQILQSSSSPETIVALLNAAEERYSPTPKHWNAKRVYPFWKTCKVCSQPFATHNPTQAIRNKTCSPKCAGKSISKARRGKLNPKAHKRTWFNCPVCGCRFWRHTCHLKRIKMPTCSRHCNGILRGKELAKHAHKGRAAWTEKSLSSYLGKMSGPNNPAWKGGVTYFKTHGNYAGVKYVRCPPEYLPMARKDGYVMEHRLIVAQAMGRCLLRREVVHHIDHNPTNNALSNLLLFASNQQHKLYEAQGSPAPLWRL